MNRSSRFLPQSPWFDHFVLFAVLTALLSGLCLGWSQAVAADEKDAVQARLSAHVGYLASDDLEGRGVGTKGLELAADYIAGQFAEIGLRTEVFDGTPYQRFQIATVIKPAEGNQLRFVGPAEEGDGGPEQMVLKPETDFKPMAMSGSDQLDWPLAFAGYGITATEEKYDDYEGLDVEGRAVIVLRHEPQQDDPDSVFNGTDDSQYAALRRKAATAFQHGAKAVIFCTDQHDIHRSVRRLHGRWRKALDALVEARRDLDEDEQPSLEEIEQQRKRIAELLERVARWSERLAAAYDPLLSFEAGGQQMEAEDFVVVHCRRAVIDRLLKAALGTELAELEAEIDRGPTPHSALLEGWRVVGRIKVERVEAEVKNVVGVLAGQGPLADQTLVIGAHYDHLGKGGPGSRSPGQQAVHNGADDNASGVAAMLEVARGLAQRGDQPRRTVLFVAFTAEERGLVGSSRYVREPPIPIEQTVAMLNLDMVGRLRDNKLTVSGTGTAEQFAGLLDKLNEQYAFQLVKKPSGFGPSDHTSFYAKKVPVMHFFTGTHEDYHRPTDDVERLNMTGLGRITRFVTDVAWAIATDPEKPRYVSVPRGRRASGGDRPFFGSVPDFGHQGDGYALSAVTPGGPAERAGLRAGDVIVQFGDSQIASLEDFAGALRKYEPGDRVGVVVLRAGQRREFQVTLDEPR